MVRAALTRRLQLITTSPLIIGIILSAIISVSITFIDHLSWLYDSRTSLTQMELSNLNQISGSLSDSFKTLTESVILT